MTDDAGGRWDGRRRAREAALQMLYQCEVGRLDVGTAAALLARVGRPEAVSDLDAAHQAYAEALAGGAWSGRAAIDERIGDAARNWRVERLTALDRAVLRLAVHELLDQPATPPRVVLNEAIELARAYSGDEAARFVNGVLDGVLRRLREEGRVVDER